MCFQCINRSKITKPYSSTILTAKCNNLTSTTIIQFTLCLVTANDRKRVENLSD